MLQGVSWEGAIWAVALAMLTLCVSWKSSICKERARRSFPPGPPALPVVGHLYPLATPGQLHRKMRSLAAKYGPIIGLRLGRQAVVVVSSVSLVRESLVKQDKAFASRPPFGFSDSLFHGYATGIMLSPYGPQWRKLRKLCTLHLFTPLRLLQLQHLRQEEVENLIVSLRAASHGCTAPVDFGQCVAQMTANLTSRLLQSRPPQSPTPAWQSPSHPAGCHDYKLQHLMDEMVQEMGLGLEDFIPWLKWIDMVRMRRLKRLHTRLDGLLDAILTERRQAMLMQDQHEQAPNDLLHALLSLHQSDEDTSIPSDSAQLGHERVTTAEIKSVMLDMLGGGILTTSSTVEWAMAELLRNPHCLSKLQKEIDIVVGKGKQVTELHLSKLSYLTNTVKEVLRLHPVLPLLLRSISMEACKVENYMLPKNTLFLVNAWAIGRDEQVWRNADTFIPERFQDKDIDVRGQHCELLAFGCGRRLCPGLALGLCVVQLTLANLVNRFHWELPKGESYIHIDMSEKTRFIASKATPLLVVPRPPVFA